MFVLFHSMYVSCLVIMSDTRPDPRPWTVRSMRWVNYLSSLGSLPDQYMEWSVNQAAFLHLKYGVYPKDPEIIAVLDQPGEVWAYKPYSGPDVPTAQLAAEID
jgi:hypothetical protein